MDWEKHGRGKLFAFYNSGPDSGASQPHRHIQFLPVAEMHEGVPNGSWSLPSDEESRALRLPLAVKWISLRGSNSLDTQTIYRIYQKLLEEMESLFHEPLDGKTLSYNLAMTSTDIMVCPRSCESVTLKDDKGTEMGSLSPNGTLLGGTLMVKSREAFDFMRAKTAPESDLCEDAQAVNEADLPSTSNALDQVLAAVGIQSPQYQNPISREHIKL